jgi:hypothetical protein
LLGGVVVIITGSIIIYLKTWTSGHALGAGDDDNERMAAISYGEKKSNIIIMGGEFVYFNVHCLCCRL